MPLTPDQKARADRAREVLDERPPAGSRDTGELINDLSVKVGKLEYWLRDVLLLVGELTAEPPANVRSIQRKYGG